MKIKSDGPMGCRMIDTASQFSTKFNQINSNVTREDRIEILNNVIIEWSYLSGQVVDNNSFYDYFTPNWDYFYDLKEISPVEWINRKSLDRIYDFYVKDYKPNQYEKYVVMAHSQTCQLPLNYESYLRFKDLIEVLGVIANSSSDSNQYLYKNEMWNKKVTQQEALTILDNIYSGKWNATTAKCLLIANQIGMNIRG